MKTKVCSKCKIYKPLLEFYKQSDKKDGLTYQCKDCIAKRLKKYYIDNKQNILMKGKIYEIKIKSEMPWKAVLHDIKQRCNNPNNRDYKWYGGRGIKCLITIEELKFLWMRDKASEMKKPTIDRKDNDNDYTFENCQFLELKDNVLKMDLKRNSLGQFLKKY